MKQMTLHTVTGSARKCGPAVPGAVETLRWLQKLGCPLILWTMRHGRSATAAVQWLGARGIAVESVNENKYQISPSRKALATVYIDDRNAGCPMIYPPPDENGVSHYPYVDWAAIGKDLRHRIAERGLDPKNVSCDTFSRGGSDA